MCFESLGELRLPIAEEMLTLVAPFVIRIFVTVLNIEIQRGETGICMVGNSQTTIRGTMAD